jgi:hypothetical protein
MNSSKPTISLTLANKFTLLICLILVICSHSNAQNAYVYENGTNWHPSLYNIINSNDPSAFESIHFEGEKHAEMWDRDADNNNGALINPISWVFKLTYEDGITSEIRIRILGFTKDQGLALAKKYGKKMGQLPACLRKGVGYINILKSDALFGGNNFKHSIEITIGETSELYEQTGNMEETLFHESTHAALDNLYQEDWPLHRDKDQKYISKYAADNPNREDISESFLMYAAVKHRTDRIQSEVAKINKNISNRLEFYNNKKFDMYPFTKNVSKESNQFELNSFYRITNQWQGDNKSLGIVENGKNMLPMLLKTENESSQMWQIKKIGTDIYVLSSKLEGPAKVLSCVEGRNQNLLLLNQESGDSGSTWKIIPSGIGFYRITNMCLNDCSIDVINEGDKNKLQVAKTGNYTGQYWKITKIE